MVHYFNIFNHFNTADQITLNKTVTAQRGFFVLIGKNMSNQKEDKKSLRSLAKHIHVVKIFFGLPFNSSYFLNDTP